MKRRVFAFIDSQNLNLGVANDVIYNSQIVRGWKLDFGRFYTYLKDKYKVDTAYLFIGYVAENHHLYKQLKSLGYNLIYKPTQHIAIGNKQIIKGNVDAELVLHTMICLPLYDSALIVTGDGDFYCLVEYLKSINKLEAILIPNKFKYSSLLRKFSKYINFVSTKKDKLELKNTKERYKSQDKT